MHCGLRYNTSLFCVVFISRAITAVNPSINEDRELSLEMNVCTTTHTLL